MELQETALASENSLQAELSLVEEEYFEGRENHAEDESSGMSSDNDCDPDRRSPPNTWTTEIRELDKEEEENVRQFSETTCGCSKKQGSPCSSYFTQVELAEIRMSMAELERDQLDLVGQNKNNIMVSYLTWRVMVGLNKPENLHFAQAQSMPPLDPPLA